MVTRGGRWGQWILREFGINMYTLLYIKWMTNKDPLCSTGNSALCYVAAWMGGGFGENVCAQWCPTWDPLDRSSLSMKFFRQEYWCGLPFPPPWDLPDPLIEQCLWCILHCRLLLYHWTIREALWGEWTYVYVYVWLSPLPVNLKLSQHC